MDLTGQRFGRLTVINKVPLITVANKTMTLAMWARERNINPHTIQSRLRSGWSDLEALEFVERK